MIFRKKKVEKVASPRNWTRASWVTCQAANHYTTWPVRKIEKILLRSSLVIFNELMLGGKFKIQNLAFFNIYKLSRAIT